MTAALVVIWACFAGGFAAAEQPLSVADYRTVLAALRTAAAISPDAPSPAAVAVLARLPPRWHIVASGYALDVPTGPIRRDVDAWQRTPSGDARRRVIADIDALAGEAESFDPLPPDRSAERARLADILSRREFRGVAAPSWLDRVWQRMRDFFRHLSDEATRRVRIFPIAVPLVYLLAALSAAAFAIWAWRIARDRRQLLRVAPRHAAVQRSDWPRWLADANRAAAEERWRDAMHSIYWCAIAFLEARGAWRPDRARTPRESIRLLAPASREAAALGELTERLELVWYGVEPANRAIVDASRRDLAALGCPGA